MRRTRLHWMVLVAVSALTACSDSGTGNGGSGGAAGTGGTAGAGGIAGTGGAGGMGGMGGMGGTAGTGGMGSPPEATIITPGTDSGTSNPDYAYDGFDSDLGLWYKDVMLEGSGVDLEDGALSGDALVWKTNQTEIQPEVLGAGENITVRLYSDDCFGVTHVITLEVTDSSEQATVSEPLSLMIWTLC